MSKKHSNFYQNYPRVIKYLKDNNIPYQEYNLGYHLKIMGAVRFIELWPSLMKFHIVESEIPTSTSYSQLSPIFVKSEIDKLLNGYEHI